MRVIQGAGGQESVIYEAGDLVRLRRDEQGPIVTAFAGDWGRITQVHPDGSVDIKLAGYGRSSADSITRATGVARRLLEPCDTQGRATLAMPRSVWGTRQERASAD
jgi:hypothetical protein